MFKKSGKTVFIKPYNLVERFSQFPQVLKNNVEINSTSGKNNKFSMVTPTTLATYLCTINYLFETTVAGRVIHNIHKAYYYYYEVFKYINNNNWKGTK